MATSTLDDGALHGPEVRRALRPSTSASRSTSIGQGPTRRPAPCDPANYPHGLPELSVRLRHSLGGDFPTTSGSGHAGAARGLQQPGQRQPRSGRARVLDQRVRRRGEERRRPTCRRTSRATRWSGNVGLRYVQTEGGRRRRYVSARRDRTPARSSPRPSGTFMPSLGQAHVQRLCCRARTSSANLTDDLVARFAAAETMTRPDYSALAGSYRSAPRRPPSTSIGSGSGGNPDLKPIRSTNFDAGLEWYFAQQLAAVGVALFYMDLDELRRRSAPRRKSYLTFSTLFPDGQDAALRPDRADQRARAVCRASSSPTSRRSRTTSASFANYTYADGKQTDGVPINGDDRLVGTSKNTYNVGGYYENDELQRAPGLHLPLGVLQRASTATRAFSRTTIGYARGVAGLHVQRELLDHPGRPEPEQPDAQVLRARTRTSRARSTRTARSTT